MLNKGLATRIICLSAQLLVLSSAGALAQNGPFFDGPSEVILPVVTPPAPTPPPPDPAPPPPAPTPPFIPLPPPHTVPFRPGVVVPTDVTNNTYSGAGWNPASALGGPNNAALNGIQKLNERNFPRQAPKEDDNQGILVKWRPETIFIRPQNNVVKLTSGEVLISVKAPAKHANLLTPIGKVALEANSDILARYENGIFRLKNI